MGTAEDNIKKIVLIIANKNFRDEEYLIPKQILAESGVSVVTASSALVEAQGSYGAKVKPDILLNDVKVQNFDAVVFVGGSGSKEYFDNPIAHRIAKEAVAGGKVVASICSAGVILAKAGVLAGRKATVFPADVEHLRVNKANYTGKNVEVDGNIITADGPASASIFAEAIKNHLK